MGLMKIAKALVMERGFFRIRRHPITKLFRTHLYFPGPYGKYYGCVNRDDECGIETVDEAVKLSVFEIDEGYW